jgi:hypothetical protein
MGNKELAHDQIKQRFVTTVTDILVLQKQVAYIACFCIY